MSSHATSSTTPNSLQSQHQLALNYYHGTNGITQHKVKAFVLFKKCAEESHPKSMLELGCMYFLGEHQGGMPSNSNGAPKRNFEQALKWWSKEELRDDREALYGIGMIYHLGSDTVPQNARLAEEYLEKSAQMGYKTAEEVLNQYYRRRRSSDKAPEDDTTSTNVGSIFHQYVVGSSLVLDETNHLRNHVNDVKRQLTSVEGHLLSRKKEHTETKAELTEIQRMLRKQSADIIELKKDISNIGQQAGTSPKSGYTLPTRAHNDTDTSLLESDAQRKSMRNVQQSVDDMSHRLDDTSADIMRHIASNQKEIISLREEFRDHQAFVQTQFQRLYDMMHMMLQQRAQESHSNSFDLSLPALGTGNDPFLSSSNNFKKSNPKNNNTYNTTVTQEFSLGQRGNNENSLPPLETLKKRIFSSIDVQKEIHAKSRSKSKEKKLKDKHRHKSVPHT